MDKLITNHRSEFTVIHLSLHLLATRMENIYWWRKLTFLSPASHECHMSLSARGSNSLPRWVLIPTWSLRSGWIPWGGMTWDSPVYQLGDQYFLKSSQSKGRFNNVTALEFAAPLSGENKTQSYVMMEGNCVILEKKGYIVSRLVIMFSVMRHVYVSLIVKGDYSWDHLLSLPFLLLLSFSPFLLVLPIVVVVVVAVVVVVVVVVLLLLLVVFHC